MFLYFGELVEVCERNTYMCRRNLSKCHYPTGKIAKIMSIPQIGPLHLIRFKTSHSLINYSIKVISIF